MSSVPATLASAPRRLLIPVVFILLVTLSAQSQTLSIDTPAVDAGTIVRGTILTRDFIVRNVGAADLDIDVTPACGCATAKFDRFVRPGAQGKITLTIDTTSFKGPISKSATVVSNDPVNPEAKLIVVANVKSFVDVLPSDFIRFQTAEGETRTTEVTLVSDHPGFKPTGVTTSAKYLRATLTADQVPTRWKVFVTCDSGAPVGPLADSVTVQTGIAQEPYVRLAISGVVRPRGTRTDTADSNAAAKSEPGMTNDDVVKLVAAGLDDEVVIAKVKNTRKVQFDLTTDALLRLKAQKVNKTVVAAMIERDATQQQAAPSKAASAAAAPAPAPAPQNPCAGVELMGVFKEDMRPMSPLIIYMAKIRNGTNVTRMVTLQWLNMYAEELQSSVEIGAGQLATLKLAAQEPFQRQPTNLKISSCR